jgi:hydrogenase maturation protease
MLKQASGRTLVLGIGNTILSDDGVGCRVVEKIKEKINDQNIDFREGVTTGLRLLDLIAGYDRVIIIDAIQSGKNPPGTLTKIGVDDLNYSVHSNSPHGINLASAIELGRQLGVSIPPEIHVYAIEIQDAVTISEKLTPKVEAAIPSIVEKIVKELKVL